MSEGYPRLLTDADVLAIQEELQRTGLRRVSKAVVQDAIELYARQNSYHPVREYLACLEWDQETRIKGWLSRYLGVEGCDYSDEIGRLFLIAMIARVMRPGCKVDYMLILEGPQGAMKSTACKVLAGKWFSDNLPDLARGDAVRLSMHLRGKWLIEIAEMSSFNAAESHKLKEFLTQTEERYTPKYGRQEVKEPRQCIFVGTTNEGAYLKDATGARRFWPVKVGVIDIEGLTKDRDQLLAEAYAEFKRGAQWWPDRAFEAAHIAPQQEARYEADPWEEAIEGWLGGGPVFAADGTPVYDEEGNQLSNAKIDRCTVNGVLSGAIGLKTGMFGTREQRRVSVIFQRWKWARKKSNGRDYYIRPGTGA